MLLSKFKKAAQIIFFVIVIVTILTILQYAIHYYSHPIQTKYSVTKSGCLLFKDNTTPYEIISVDIELTQLHYFFKNHEDAIQGEIYLNNHSIFDNNLFQDENKDDIGFYSRFLENSNYTSAEIHGDNNLCKSITISKDLDIVCALNIDSTISDNDNLQTDEIAILVIPYSNINSTYSQVREFLSNSEQMTNWFKDNDLNTVFE